jgi:hypothetical protein
VQGRCGRTAIPRGSQYDARTSIGDFYSFAVGRSCSERLRSLIYTLRHALRDAAVASPALAGESPIETRSALCTVAHRDLSRQPRELVCRVQRLNRLL